MPNPNTFTFEAIGTHWQIDIEEPLPQNIQKQLLNEVHQIIDEFDSVYSRFRGDSLIATIAKEKGTYRLPDNAQPLLALYQQLYQLTDGAFTPLIGNVLVEAGYDQTYSLKATTLHHPAKWEDVMEYQYPNLIVKSPVLLDVGAGGKGYLIDLIATFLASRHISCYCIDAGGDIYYRNSNQTMLRVGLEHPTNTQQVIGVATILNKSICGSAGNRRKWGNFHHIIDPSTLSSPSHILATWVIAKTTLIADSLATALFFTSAAKLKKEFTFDYVIINHDFSLEKSPKFPAEFFTKN